MADQYRHCQNCRKDIAISNYVIHSAHCERRIQLCSLCNEPIPISEKDKHLEEYHSVEACELCNERMEKWQIAKHKDVCLKRPVDCKFCDLQLPLSELEEHCNMCGARTEKCTVCNCFILRKELERHSKICQNVKIENTSTCEYCQIKVSSNIFGEHVASCGAKTEKCNKCDAFIMQKNRRTHICKTQSLSKTHGECPICHSIVSWIDMREHEACCRIAMYQSDDDDDIENLKSEADKQQFTSHKKFKQADSRTQRRTENSSNIQKLKKCDYCNERFPDLIMSTHFESCQERPYKCELCLKTILFKKKVQHELSDCPLIHGRNDELPGYAASGYTKSYEKKLKDCVYCETKFPELVFQEHLGMCDERPYQCDLCCKGMPFKEKAGHETFECKFRDKKNQHFSDSVRENSKYTVAEKGYSRYADPQREHSKYSHSERECSKYDSNEREYPKHSGPEREYPKYSDPEREYQKHSGPEREYPKYSDPEREYQKHSGPEREYPKYSDPEREYQKHSGSEIGYTKGAPIYTKSFEKDFPEINYRNCPFCNSKIPELKIADHVQLCSEQKKLCQFCGEIILIVEEYAHLHNCIGARNVIDESVPQTPQEQGFQLAGNKRNKNKKKNQKQKEPLVQSPPRKFFWSSLLPNKKESPPKQEFTPPIHPMYTPETPEIVLLPCEFCSELFPDALIIEHQSGCRPDLVSFPKEEMGPLSKARHRKIDESDRNVDIEIKSTVNVRNTGAKPKIHQDFRTSPVIAPGEYLTRRSPPKEAGSPPRDYYNYPSGVPYYSFQRDENDGIQTKSFQEVQDIQRDRPAVTGLEDKTTVKNPAKIKIFNFKSSSSGGDISPDNQTKASKYNLSKEIYQSPRQRFSEDENTELKAVGAERAEKKEIFHIPRDTLTDSKGVFSDVSVGAHDSRYQLSPSIAIPSENCSDKKYQKKDLHSPKLNYSEGKLNIRFDEETSNIMESEKVKTTPATRLLERLENPDFHTNTTKSWDEHRSEDDAKNNETFGDDFGNLNENFNIHPDNLSDSGEHFYDAEDDFKVPSIEGNASASSSPNIDSNLDVYFKFLRKDKHELIDSIDLKNERTPTPVVESASECECGNELCYCAISNQPASFENNNFVQKEEKSEGTYSNKPPVFNFQRALETLDIVKTTNTNSEEGNMLNGGQFKSSKAEIEKQTAFTQWRENELYNSDSD